MTSNRTTDATVRNERPDDSHSLRSELTKDRSVSGRMERTKGLPRPITHETGL